MWSAAPMRAHELLVTEALRIEALDRPLAALMLADAALAAASAAETARAVETAERAMRLGHGLGGKTEATVSAIAASILLIANRGRTSSGLVRSALARIPASSDALDVLEQSATALYWTEEYAGAARILVQVIERGRLLRWPGLPIALDTLAAVEFRTGRWPSADAHSAEALRLARDRGRAFEIASASTTLARVAAARGAEADCRSLLDDARSLAGAGTLAAAYTASAGGFLELSLGRPEAAIRELEPLTGRAGQLRHGGGAMASRPDRGVRALWSSRGCRGGARAIRERCADGPRLVDPRPGRPLPRAARSGRGVRGGIRSGPPAPCAHADAVRAGSDRALFR